MFTNGSAADYNVVKNWACVIELKWVMVRPRMEFTDNFTFESRGSDCGDGSVSLVEDFFNLISEAMNVEDNFSSAEIIWFKFV